MDNSVEISIRVDGQEQQGQDQQAMRSLYRWLAQDPQVQRDASISLVPSPAGRGEMGSSTLELINVVLSNGLALSSVLVAVAAWRDARTSNRAAAPTTRIERNGVSVTVQDASPETVRQVVDALLNDAPGIADTDEIDEPV